MLTKTFHFDSPRDHYVSDAAVLWCFDYRFHRAFEKFLKRSGVVQPDVIRIAGGAKALASPALENEREYILDQIRKSIALHATKRVVLMVHSDCGAYGGLKAFGGDVEAEVRHHEAELDRAAQVVSDAFPGIEVTACFVDFEGVWTGEKGAPACNSL